MALDMTLNDHKRLHRIWLDDDMPELFTEYGQQWRILHPDWDVTDWRHTEDLPKLINQDIFDHARDICPSDWKRFQADLLRLELLDQFGGVYADTDVQPLKPLDPLMDRRAWIAHSPHHDTQGRPLLTQCIMAAEPGHPFIRACIDTLPDAVERYRDRPLAQMIGPHHITRVWNQHPQEVTIYPTAYFFPQSNPERDRGLTPDLSEAYVWHRWNTTLRKRGKGLG